MCGVMLPGLASTCPRSSSFFSTPRSSRPTLSPAMPESSVLLNISTPVTIVLRPFSACRPMISTSSPDLDHAALDTAGADRAAALDAEHVFDRHQEGLVLLALRFRDVLVECRHELDDRPKPGLVLGKRRLQAVRGGAADDGDIVAVELVLAQQLADFHLDQLEQLGVVHEIDLVQEHDQGRHVDLPGQQHVLARLRHRPVRGADDQDGPVHLGRAGDHVLDVVRVPRAVNVGIMTVFRLILHVGSGDRQNLRRVAATVLLGSLGDIVIRLVYAQAAGRLHGRHRGRQRGLAVVHVPDGPDVHVRFGSRKYALGHGSSPLVTRGVTARCGLLSATDPCYLVSSSTLRPARLVIRSTEKAADGA